MSGNERDQGRHLPQGSPAPRPDRPQGRFLGTADPDPVPLAGILPGSPAEALALGTLVLPEGKPLLVEMPTDPSVLSPAAIEALAGMIELLDGGPSRLEPGQDNTIAKTADGDDP